QGSRRRPPRTSSGGRIRPRSGGFRLIAAGLVVSPWPRRLRGPRTPEPVSTSCPDPAHYGAPPWSRVPRHPPHVWKDPDIILKEYDVSHRLSVSSYISIFRSLFGDFSLSRCPEPVLPRQSPAAPRAAGSTARPALPPPASLAAPAPGRRPVPRPTRPVARLAPPHLPFG